jgi:hypothetical protein
MIKAMSKKQIYDIFISYRRTGGFETAQLLSDRLTRLGYRVFFDLETMRSGAFNAQIYRVIESCKDVIVIVNPDIFARAIEQQHKHVESGAKGSCPSDPTDWVRLEVAHAFQQQKNVIPMCLRQATMPSGDKLPADIAPLPMQHGCNASEEHFNATIQRLCSYLQAKPHRQYWLLPLISVCLLLVCLLGWSILGAKKPEFPVTPKEKAILQEVCAYIVISNGQLAMIFQAEQEFLNRCSDLIILSNKQARYAEVQSEYRRAKEALARISSQIRTPSDALRNDIALTPFNLGNFMRFPQLLETLLVETLESIEQMKEFFKPEELFSNSDLATLIRLNQNWVHANAEQIRNGTMGFLAPVQPEAIKEPIEALRSITAIPYTAVAWSNDKDFLKQEHNTIFNRMEQMLTDRASLVGDWARKLRSEEKMLQEMLVADGLSEEEAQKIVEQIYINAGKEIEIEEMKKELEKMKVELEEKKKEALEKLAPSENDDVGLLWAKMRQLVFRKRYDIALECLDAYEKKAGVQEMDFATYVPSVRELIKQMNELDIRYGLVVTGYEPPATSHAVYRIGDIVVAMNDQPCFEFADINKYKNDDEAATNVVTILRQDEEGKFSAEKFELPKNQPRVGFLAISEAQP